MENHTRRRNGHLQSSKILEVLMNTLLEIVASRAEGPGVGAAGIQRSQCCR